ncbi:MAG: DUF5698 domain-containing protein [Desulfurivibrionaceae bacterium]|nr:DUF5698 domain-containing protein [Desulfobulbales bacterium]MDT8336076.1 DUF5698 domain-containing protein [Desulfurivibrionaceae bacterium]
MEIIIISPEILATGIAIFLARIADVSLGTLRTISIIRGRKWMAFGLGLIEIMIWLTVISAVLLKIRESPILGLFYAFGFATGNMVGIRIEKWLALGNINLRIISRHYYCEMATSVRAAGFPVTVFMGEGGTGPVGELYIVCAGRDLKKILSLVRGIDPNAFYISEQAVEVSKIYRPVLHPVTGWRAILKKK